MNQISLNSSMRSNLLSLQQTQALQDMTQLRLSTGLKVNSAIDNPSNYYTASSLSNRAKDLSSLLDAMSQGIQTIKAASETLTAATKYLEQAKAVAVKASESDMDIIAKVKTEDELLAAVNSGKTGYIVITSDINLTNQIKLKDNQNLVGDNYFKEYNGANRKLNFDFTDSINIAGIISGNNSIISNLNIDYKYNKQLSATSVNKGVVNIDAVKNVTLKNLNMSIASSTSTGNIFGIFMRGSSVANAYENININGYGERIGGIGIYGNSVLNTSATLNITTNSTSVSAIKIGNNSTQEPEGYLNIKPDSEINISAQCYGIIVYANSLVNISDTKLNISAKLYGIFNTENSKMNINKSIVNVKSGNAGIYINGEVNIKRDTMLNIELTSNLASAFGINLSSHNNLGSYLNLDGTSRINIKTMTSTQTAIRMGVNITTGVEAILNIKTGAIINMNRGNALDGLFTFSRDHNARNTYGTMNINDFSAADANKSAKENIIINDPIIPNIDDELKKIFTGDFESKETNEGKQYNTILDQYNQLINDAGYKGINLLLSQDLKVNFNEERSSKIDVKGVDASTKGLGLTDAKWQSQTDIQKSLDEISSAINQIRSHSSEFGNYYSVVNSRIDFTDNLINVLTEGSDKLTLADMNESSANMLALQTRQQLAINALSLANQASQSVLRLF